MSAPAHPNRSGGDRVSLERFVTALETAGVWHQVRGDRVTFRCPLPDHEDVSASGTADWRGPAGGRPGSVRLLCHRCGRGATDAILAALGLGWSDLFDDAPARPDPSSPRAGRRGRSAPSPARSAAPRSSAPAAPSGDKSTAPARVPTRATRYLFCDADGELVARLTRFDPIDPAAGARKAFKWEHRGGPRGGWASGKPDGGVPLYRLPTVAAAVAAGARVWLVEGCKNADDLAGHVGDGEAVTTPPDGAGSSWSPEWTAVLAGAAVTVVADRDDPGIAHAARVAVELAAAGCAVRVVRTPLDERGADVSDHLDAGLGLDALEDVPADVLSLPARPGSDDDPDDGHEAGGDAAVLPGPWSPREERPGGGGGSGGGSDAGADTTYVRDEFGTARSFGETRDALVKVKHQAATETRPARRLLVEVLDADVRITRRLHRDAGDGTDPGTTHVDLSATRDGESVELRAVEWDEFRKVGPALARLPWALSWKDTPAGRSDVVNAITAASGPVPVVPTYGTLGWWEISGRWVYMHAGGGIDADGPVAGVEAALSPRLRGFTLPTPPDGAGEVAAALDGVLSVLDELPARVAAPVLGAPLRAMLGETRASVFVLGYTGSRKSGLAALAQQMHYPAARHDRLPLGAGEQASTPTATEHLMWEAAHALLVADDLAPDRSAERSATRANELLRMAGNGTARARGARVGGLREDRPPQTCLMLTGEDGASRLSAESRTVYVPLAPAAPTDPESGDVPLSVIRALSSRERIAGRNATAAALARHVAGRMPAAEWVEASRDDLSAALLAACGHLDTDGLMPRRANAVAELATGWRALLDMAADTGALDADERTRVWARVWAGLVECLCAQAEVSDRRAMVEHAADLLRSAIRGGSAFLEDGAGGCPGSAELRGVCGWEPVGRPEDGEFRSSGRAVGWTDGARVWLDPGSAFAAIEGQGAAERDPLNVTRRALTSALVASGLLASEQQPGRRSPSPQVRRYVGGARQRVLDLPWSWLWPDGAEHDPAGEDGPPDPGPDTTPPPLVPDTSAHPPDADVPPSGTSAAGAAAQDPPERAASSAGTRRRVDLPWPLTGPYASAAPSARSARGDRRSDPDPAAGGCAPPRSADTDAAERPETPHTAPGDPRSASPAPTDRAASPGRSGPAERPSVRRAGYAAAAVVVDVDGAWLTSGGPVEVPDVATLPALMDWARTLGLGTAHPYSRDDAGQVWVMPRLARALGLRGRRPPKDSARSAPARALGDAGWRLGRAGLSDWTHLFREGERSLLLVVVPWQSESELCPGDDPPTGAVLADRIELYRHLTGQPFLMSAGATGTALLGLAQSTARKGRLTEPIEQPPPAMAKRCNLVEPEWAWRRAVSPEEAAGATRAIRYDLNAAYLAAAMTAELGLGDPEHVTDPDALARAVAAPAKLPPGYWLLDRSTVTPAQPDLPDLLDVDDHAADQLWVTTPSLRAVLEAGHALDAPAEAWVWREHTRWLQPWGERLRDALYAVQDWSADGVDADGSLRAVRQTVKLSYAAGIGMLGSLRFRGPSPERPNGSRDFRPDARHHVIGTEKANLWRKVLRTALDPADGRVPIAIARDAVVYLAGPEHDDTIPPTGFKLGTKLGTVKIEEIMTVEHALAEHAATPQTRVEG